MSGLRECPWCGEKPDPVESLRTDSGNAGQIGKWAWIECGCGVCAPDVRAQYGNAEGWQDAAAEEWNRRALSPILSPADIARLVEAARGMTECDLGLIPDEGCTCASCEAWHALTAALAPFTKEPTK